MRLGALFSLVALSLTAGMGCRMAPRRAFARSHETGLAPAPPVSVSAMRYRTWVGRAGGGMKEGHIVEALWFPEWRLEAWTYTERWTGRTRLAVVHLDGPRKTTTEMVEVPWSLAERIRRWSGLQDEVEDECDRLGSDLRDTALLRKVPAGDGG